MLRFFRSVFTCVPASNLWDSKRPVREELFSNERLEEHAISLAKEQKISSVSIVVPSLQSRLSENAAILLNAYNASAKELEQGRGVVPAAEWLLDNYHLVEQQIREIKDDLPIVYYRQLPKLVTGPFVGYPRVFGLAWAYVAHTDSYFDSDNLMRFVKAYQTITPLTIGELWAIAITLRIVLIENLRRLVDQITVGREARADANQLTDNLLVSGQAQTVLLKDIETRSSEPLSQIFAAQLAKRLRDQDPRTTPALEWLEQRLDSQGLTVEEVVLHSQLSEGTSNVSVRNVINSMRWISDIDWTEQFEKASLVDITLRASSNFADMDFSTRNAYRDAIEQLARGCGQSELVVTELAIKQANLEGSNKEDKTEAKRFGDPGYYLIDEGRENFEESLHFRPSLGLWCTRLHKKIGLRGYVSSIILLASIVLLSCLYYFGFAELPWYVFISAFCLGLLPATEISTAIINRSVTWRLKNRMLAGLELKSGVPSYLRTLIAVPILLTNEYELSEQVERLEVHYLGGVAGDLSFVLLVDGVDANEAELDTDAPMLAFVSNKIKQLNQRYKPGKAGNRFLLLYRRRQFNQSENTWMAWERKRGKLHELNRLLRGATDTSFVSVAGLTSLEVPKNVRYVITLDADTQLPREAVLRLIGKMAHPLNRPRFNPVKQRIEAGYGIIQPRVTPSLPVGTEGSFYQRVISSPAGIDPYAAATSDVYQDLFAEGSFTGKGIYDVDAFEAALEGRVQVNSMLSHDLFEGIFARSALVSDVQVVEEFPARYDVLAKRQHRWTRGDWQLLPWIVGKFSGKQSVSWLGRWKLLDNLRRSLIAPMTLLALILSWLLPLDIALISTVFLILTIVIPVIIPSLCSLVPPRPSVYKRNHYQVWLNDFGLAFAKVVLALTYFPDQTWRTMDAIGRTIYRLVFSRRHLLEWTSTAQSNGIPPLDMMGFYQTMCQSTILSQIVCLSIIAVKPAIFPLVLPFSLLWLSAPAIAFISSRSNSNREHQGARQHAPDLRLIARRTWRYFETFVSIDDNMLPPDNFQETPEPIIAHRTSPTNIGLYLLSAVAARDFAWIGLIAVIERLEATFLTLGKLPKYRGHLYNWYGTQNLEILEPAYISSVDSGNLAGHLIALANACDDWRKKPCNDQAMIGIKDNLQLLNESVFATKFSCNEQNKILADIIGDMSTIMSNQSDLSMIASLLIKLCDKAMESIFENLMIEPLKQFTVDLSDNSTINVSDIHYWLIAIKQLCTEHLQDIELMSRDMSNNNELANRLTALAKIARDMAHAMDFAFLMDPKRKLMSIGYSQTDNSLDPSCYDLLASESRLTSLFAIAKGDVSTKHWFHLDRTATLIGKGSALISWSGSMFEYLMPSLVIRAPRGSLLDQSNHLIVQRQIDYGRQLGIVWGISESAFNARDIHFTYQYSNFGVPGLGLKRGLSEDIVIAPYATGLACMTNPGDALKNYQALEELGAMGRYGFYEAVDFTVSRLPTKQNFAIVNNFMAHHQGMTIVAILNAVQQGLMRLRFHKEPCIQACELLLQERMPRDIAISHPRAEEVKASNYIYTDQGNTVRKIDTSELSFPIIHLLSNGRYAVMLTATGAGYSRWGNFAITRWQQDCTSDSSGTFILLRDVESSAQWSSTVQPFTGDKHQHPCIFSEDHAEFSLQKGNLTTTMDVLISSEDDGEVRRVSVSNKGHFSHEIDFTSFAELVLAPSAGDNAHPAFSKMFVQTEYLPQCNALIATRRKRSEHEPSIWAAHFVVVEGELTADIQYETSRAKFIGRGNTIANAYAMAKDSHSSYNPLSNTVGCVLDPIFSLRYRLKVHPGNSVRLSFWTLVASSKDELIDLIDRHQDVSAYDRAKTLAWTQAQVQLRHWGIDSSEVADFQNLAAPILYSDYRFKAPSATIVNGIKCQSELWEHSISGDLPIVLMRIDDVEDIDKVKQLLRAHEYWRMKRLAVDIIIINEHPSSYRQKLHNEINACVRRSASRPRFNSDSSNDSSNGSGPLTQDGSVYVFRLDQLSGSMRDMLYAIAKVILVAQHGLINKQIYLKTKQQTDKGTNNNIQTTKKLASYSCHAKAGKLTNKQDSLNIPELEYDNGWGGFSDNGKEYVIRLQKGQKTPSPWINVIANPSFGFHVSAEGSGYTWCKNSRENQLTPWSNDAVSDPINEIVYVQDQDSGELFTATAQPLQDLKTYVVYHGRGYSRFEHQVDGLTLSLLHFVPLADPVKLTRLTITNHSLITRKLSVTQYTEWVLGNTRGHSGAFISTEKDEDTQAILLRNRWGMAFPERVAFADMSGQQQTCTSDRNEFIGSNGQKTTPKALAEQIPLSGRVGAGFDQCTALQTVIEIGPGESTEIAMFIGQGNTEADAQALIKTYRVTDINVVFDRVTTHWDTLLNKVQVNTPDRAMDIMLNGWLLYQTIACRIWARSSFYQASGAYGFRDQLQDGMSLTFSCPEQTRAHILRTAARQFVEGDVQHWWLPHSGQGVRTRISDDRVWLAVATAHYIKTAGDPKILSELVPFLEGKSLDDDEHDVYFTPTVAPQSASLFEHCARGLEQCIMLTGEHGLPLIGTGDWNDGMNLVGAKGKGESVWLGWLLVHAIDELSKHVHEQNSEQDKQRVLKWQQHAKQLRKDIELHAWDGKWYRRATYDDGSWLGAHGNKECRIDSIAQSWAVLANGGDDHRLQSAMTEVNKHLIKKDDNIALLFTPPFDKTEQNPGYIKGYPPGLRENGGQYSHAAMWYMLALAKDGNGKKAVELFSMLNPINHANTPDKVQTYKVEPYVVAADIYSVAPFVGQGGWTWYTGAAGWMYQAGLEGILGISKEGHNLVIKPSIPVEWPGFSATISFAQCNLDITVDNKVPLTGKQIQGRLDGDIINSDGTALRVRLEKGNHTLVIYANEPNGEH